jgi:carbamoyl-phosphate synthase large subunit
VDRLNTGIKKMNGNKAPTILITGAGGPAIPTIIESLRKKIPNIRIIAGDMSEYAVGFHFADLGVVLPPGNDRDFLDCVKKIVVKEGISIIISVVDEELSKLGSLDSDDLKVIQPNNNFIDLCLNKIDLFNKLRDLTISVPKTILASDRKENDVIFPVIIKPIVGRGSRGIAIANNQVELEMQLAKSEYKEKDLLIQKYIQGDEYTVSVVAWRDNVIHAIVPKLVLVKQGVTKLAKTEKNLVVMEYCELLHKALQPGGPYNIQLVLDKQSGQPYLFEINPRFSTTATLIMASGMDEVGGIIDLIENRPYNFNHGNFQENLYMARRTQDVYMTEHDYHKTKIVYG